MRFTSATIWTRLAIVPPADARKNVQLIKWGSRLWQKLIQKYVFSIGLHAKCGRCSTSVDTSTHIPTHSLFSHVCAMLLNEMVKIVILRTSSGFTLCTRCTISHPTSSSSSSECNSSYFIWQQTLCMHGEKAPISFCA